MYLILTLHTHTHTLTADVLHKLLLTEYTVSSCTNRHSQMVLSHTLREYRSVDIVSVDKWAILGVRVRPGLNMPEELHVLSFLIIIPLFLF